MPIRYRKKPLIVDAWQSFDNAGMETTFWPGWILNAMRDDVIFDFNGATYIRTLEGDMLVSNGDWIIRGINGELYPCKPDIFEKTYEPVPIA